MNKYSYSESEDEFYYCDCDCEMEFCNDDGCECDCNCECTSFEQTVSINGHQIGKIRIPIPGVKITLPIKAEARRLPINRRIKVRIPRAMICQRIPNGTLRTELSEPEKMNPKIVETGTINICALILPGAQVGNNPLDSNSKIPIRIKLEMEAANQIWQQRYHGRTYGIKFDLIHTSYINQLPHGIGKNVQDFPWNQENIEQVLFEYGKKVCPNAHVFVYYMNGNHIGPIHRNGTQTDAITFRGYPVIILSNSALIKKYIFAHELGHFMYLNNLFGYTFDPDPSPVDPDHNTNPTNLMYYKSDLWPASPQRPSITHAQIRKALNARFFYD